MLVGIELNSINAIYDATERMVYEMDDNRFPVMGTGINIDELDEEWFDELTLAENEMLMEVL